MATPKNNNPVSNSQEEDDYMFSIYIKSLLSVEEPVSIDELLGYTHKEAPTNSTHELIDKSELHDPQFSSDDLNFLLGILDGPEPIEGGAYIREDNPSQPIAAIDRNPIEEVDDELARIRRGIKTSISFCTTKSDERNAYNEKALLHGKHTSDSILALNQYKVKENEKMSSGRKPESPSKGISYRRSPAPMEKYLGPSENEAQATTNSYLSTPKRTQFEDITNKPLDQNRKRTMKVRGKGLINPASSGSNHEKEEGSEDLCQSIPQRKRKVHKSDLTREDGACKNCRCKKSKCLKRYCECFAAGVYCTGPCKCQDCSNKPITALQAPTKI